MIQLINWWPPLMFAGIRVTRFADDLREIDVELRMRFWNRNYVGTHFGGSLYAMTDPFYMLMLIEILGRDYIVWDKAAVIKFKKPGLGVVRAHFKLNEEQIQSIKTATASGNKHEPVFMVHVVDQAGITVAEVEKTLYVKLKNPPQQEKIGAAT